jgi:hypothetical protein
MKKTIGFTLFNNAVSAVGLCRIKWDEMIPKFVAYLKILFRHFHREPEEIHNIRGLG